jgi:peptide/nickel transport system substrate-binding protein
MKCFNRFCTIFESLLMSQKLIIATPPTTNGFDAESRGLNGLFIRMCYSRLFAYPSIEDENGNLVGDTSKVIGVLADSYEVSEDKMTYIVNLKKGIKSFYGNELTSKDVVWGWRRAFALRDVGKWVAIIGSVVSPDSVESINDHQVRFSLRAPNLTFLQQLTRVTPVINDSIEALKHATPDDPWASKWLFSNPCGFGPYHLDSLDPWRQATFKRNPHFFEAPNIKDVQVLFESSSRKRAAMLSQGEIDLIPNLDTSLKESLTNQTNVVISQIPSGRHAVLGMHFNHKPFDEPLVRKAIACAIPYDSIIQEAYHQAAHRWTSPMPMGTPMALDVDWPYNYNLEQAQKFLSQTEYKDGFESDLFVDAADAEHVAMAELIAHSLKGINININIEKMESGMFWAGARYFRPFSMLIYEDLHQVPDPYYTLVHDYTTGGMGLINVGQYHNEELMNIVKSIESAGVIEDRQVLVKKAQEIIINDCPYANLVAPDFLAAHSNKINNCYWAPDRSLAVEKISFKN